MVAGQSCIAGPSVCFPSYYVRFLYGSHLPFSRIGNKRYTPASVACGKSIARVHSGHLHFYQVAYSLYTTLTAYREQAFFLIPGA